MCDMQAVRELKEGQGLTNKDPQVQEAVAKLLEMKEQLEVMQAPDPESSDEADGNGAGPSASYVEKVVEPPVAAS
jgi:hypothetical protein